MPSPSQDSEKLTDAELVAVQNTVAALGADNELRGLLLRALAELYRHRTPSVPGEDMREKARKFVGLHHFGGGVFSDNITLEALREFADEIATLLSSTAALAREEAAQIADDKAAVRRALARKYADQPAISESNDRVADAHTACAAAIRAIGKEG